MKRIAVAALLLTAACGSSSNGPAPQTPAAPVTSDQQIANLQASLTELLERLDVMNDRIAKLEAAQPPASQSVLSAPRGEGARRVDEGRATTTTVTHRPVTLPSDGGAVKSANIADMYRSAIVLYGKNRFADARAAFQQVFDNDPSGDLADNALFWIGETYYNSGDYNNAIRYYKRVADEYGEQNKAPDALYKLALAYEKTSDLALARTTLQSVISRYPYSSPAASAKGELNRIKY